MNGKDVFALVFLCLVFFDFTARTKVFALIIGGLQILVWLAFSKKVRELKAEIPIGWYRYVTSAQLSLLCSALSVILLVSWSYLLLTTPKHMEPNAYLKLLIPICGLLGFILNVWGTAKEIRWKTLIKVYKLSICLNILKARLLTNDP